ncbi:MAG: cytochrome c maturation protein CcmE [bacterium]
MKARQKRFILIGLAVVAVLGAAALIVKALQSNLTYYYTPTQVNAGEVPTGQLFRIGGMVKKESLVRKEGTGVEFIVTDMKKEVTIRYDGILPDLFKEDSGTVAKGRLNEKGVFVAEEVLAKHDEDYMPPEVKATMDAAKAGQADQKAGDY